MKFLQSLVEKKTSRWILILSVAVYVLSPIDFLPEVLLPGIGLIDDGVILSLVTAELVMYKRRQQQQKTKK